MGKPNHTDKYPKMVKWNLPTLHRNKHAWTSSGFASHAHCLFTKARANIKWQLFVAMMVVTTLRFCKFFNQFFFRRPIGRDDGVDNTAWCWCRHEIVCERRQMRMHEFHVQMSPLIKHIRSCTCVHFGTESRLWWNAKLYPHTKLVYIVRAKFQSNPKIQLWYRFRFFTCK